MQLFLAIDLPVSVKKDLTLQLADLRREYPYFRWVSEDLFHVTLHFFGNIQDVEGVKKQIENSLYDVPPFHLYTFGADLFIKNQIVMYSTFQRNRAMEKLIENVRENTNVSRDLKFVPHLTFARYRIPSKQQYLLIKKKILGLHIDLEFPVTQITLLNSVIESQKPVYEQIAQFPLASET